MPVKRFKTWWPGWIAPCALYAKLLLERLPARLHSEPERGSLGKAPGDPPVPTY